MDNELMKKLTEILNGLQEAAPLAVDVCANISQANTISRLVMSAVWMVIALFVGTRWMKYLEFFKAIVINADEHCRQRTMNEGVAFGLCILFGILFIFYCILTAFITVEFVNTASDTWTWIGIFNPRLACARDILQSVAATLK